MRITLVAIAGLALLACSRPDEAPLDALDGGAHPGEDARVAMDAGAPSCPEDLTAAEGEACAQAGQVCRSSACEASACEPACIRFECESAPDGARWARRPASTCADGGPLDGGPLDGGEAPCAGADRATTIHDFGASGTVTSIVWDGTRYAIVWHALTSSDPILFSMFFALADRDGDVIPGSVHRIFETPETQSAGVLAVGDGELGLAFIRGSADGHTANHRAWFARLDRDGVPIAGSAIQLSDERSPHHNVAIAWSPVRREWAIAWGGTVPIGGGYVNHHAYLSRVDAIGEILAPNAVQLDALTSTVSPGDAPSLVWAADRWAIALAEYVEVGNTRVVVAEIDPESAEVSRRIVIDDEDARPSRVAMASDGTMYGVAWTEIVSFPPPQNAMHFRRAEVGGEALGEKLVLGEPALTSGEASLVFDGATFRLVFYEGTGSTGSVWSARIARDGTVLGTPGTLLAATPPYSAFPLIATDGCNDAVAWTAIFPTSPQRAEARLQIVAGAGAGD